MMAPKLARVVGIGLQGWWTHVASGVIANSGLVTWRSGCSAPPVVVVTLFDSSTYALPPPSKVIEAMLALAGLPVMTSVQTVLRLAVEPMPVSHRRWSLVAQ